LLIDPRASQGWDIQKENNIVGIRHKRVTPTPSKLVIFPAYLLHMVEINKSPNVRVSLSTNISVFYSFFIYDFCHQNFIFNFFLQVMNFCCFIVNQKWYFSS
jgi:hypothetical protein